MPFASLSRLMNRLTRWLCGDRKAGPMPRWMTRRQPSEGADDPYGTLEATCRLQSPTQKSD
jgi:hypothetical protein